MRVSRLASAFSAPVSNSLSLSINAQGWDDVRVELDLERGIGRADLRDSDDPGCTHGIGHREGRKERVGVTILSDMVYRPWSLDCRRVEATSLADNVPTMDVGMAWAANVELNSAAEAFREFMHLGDVSH